MDVAAGLDRDTCREYHIPTYQGVWKKLHDPTMARSHVVTCWRIMHGALPVNAFRLRVNGNLPAEEGCCGHPACHATSTLETLTHALMECPAIAPAVDWLLEVWKALTNGMHVRSARMQACPVRAACAPALRHACSGRSPPARSPSSPPPSAAAQQQRDGGDAARQQQHAANSRQRQQQRAAAAANLRCRMRHAWLDRLPCST